MPNESKSYNIGGQLTGRKIAEILISSESWDEVKELLKKELLADLEGEHIGVEVMGDPKSKAGKAHRAHLKKEMDRVRAL